ncbi:STAS domain-containing protein [Nocardia yamanashiensis]|uniref:STAS domain-containing protein n=1 Tax=Nocardia yamanashiensis TaxID=209247 RepID=UPI000AB28BD9|nr:STAS domain-containing protein [Nocardia yamanashiensis]
MTDSESSRLLTVSQGRIGDAVVVTAVGEIDINSADLLRTALDAAAAEQAETVVDLSGVHFMGSVGLSMLLAAVEQAEPRRLRVVASRQARRPIEVTGLDQALDLFDSTDAALAAEPA